MILIVHLVQQRFFSQKFWSQRLICWKRYLWVIYCQTYQRYLERKSCIEPFINRTKLRIYWLFEFLNRDAIKTLFGYRLNNQIRNFSSINKIILSQISHPLQLKFLSGSLPKTVSIKKQFQILILIVPNHNATLQGCFNNKFGSFNYSSFDWIVQLIILLLLLYYCLGFTKLKENLLFWDSFYVSIEPCVLPVVCEIFFLENFFSVIYFKALLPWTCWFERSHEQTRN